MDSDLLILIILSSCKMDCPDRGESLFSISGAVDTSGSQNDGLLCDTQFDKL